MIPYNDIENFVKGLTFDDFIKDKKTINATIRSLEVIGEAAKKVPENFRSKHPFVPWKKMAGILRKFSKSNPESTRYTPS